MRRKRRRPAQKFNRKMRTKLMVLFSLILAVLCGLIGRLTYIEHTKGETYQKKVLSMQSYDSKTIPYQRGEIIDRSGTVLATSVAVYNVILDCTVVNDKEEYVDPTVEALVKCFPELDETEIRRIIKEKKDKRYIVLAKKVPYDEVQPFVELQDAVDKKGNKVNPDIKGVWFEKEYQRNYPFGSLASSVIGFTSSGNVGTTGLENYYNSTLNGINGREYGYLDSDSDFEKTVIDAQDGDTLVTSIDANIQSIVEEKIKDWNEKYRDNKKVPYDEVQPFVELQDAVDKKGNKVNPDIKGVWFEKEYQRNYPFGSLASSVIGFTSSGNVGTTGLENYYNSTLNGINGREYGYLDSDSDFEKTVIDAQDGDTLVTSIDANIQSIVEEKIKDWNEKYRDNYYKGTGSINTAAIVMNPNNGEILAMADYPNVDLNNPRDLGKWYTKKQIKRMSEDDKMDALNEIWQNFCVSSTYEPGSVQKPFTVACGLETGTIKDKMTFDCDGYEDFNGQKVRCVARYGHGIETVRKTLMDSCNDAIMQMSYKIGKNHFTEYQSIYGFGQKTGIDLPGEANTASLMYQVEDMKPIDLATNAFGQNYNCTMVQMVSGFASLINGGTYYQPHLVTKITDTTGNTISTVEPKAVKQTISQSTSDKIRDYLQSVVKEGTGNTAKVDGYSMGGKTGTAQKFPRGNGKYLVSFMGFAPYDNPQVLIYVVVNEPNVADQPHSVFAQNIAREILEEVLPYMNIYPDEKKTGVNKGYDVTGSKDSSQYTGKHNGTKSRNEKKKKN